jgi:hypothetical protein
MENGKKISVSTVLTSVGLGVIGLAFCLQKYYFTSVSLSFLGLLLFIFSHYFSRKAKAEESISRSINTFAFCVFILNVGLFVGISEKGNRRIKEQVTKAKIHECASKLKIGQSWKDSYEEGSKYIPVAPTYYFYMEGEITPSDDGLTATGYLFGKAYYVFWLRWGHVNLDLTSKIICEGYCEGEVNQCIADISTTGNSSRQVSIVRGLFDVASTSAGNEVRLVAVFSGSLSADGGPSIEVGKEPLKLSVSWPNATAENTFQAGTYKWRCECLQE